MSKAFAKILWKFHLSHFFHHIHRLMKSQWNDFPCNRNCKHLNLCVNKFLHQFQKNDFDWMDVWGILEGIIWIYISLLISSVLMCGGMKKIFLYQQLHRRMYKMIWQIYSHPWFKKNCTLRFVGNFFKCGWFYECHLFWLGLNWNFLCGKLFLVLDLGLKKK